MRDLRLNLRDYDKYWIIIKTEDGTSAGMAIKLRFEKFRPLEFQLYEKTNTWNSCFLLDFHILPWKKNIEKYGSTKKPKMAKVERLVRIDQAREIIREIQQEMEDTLEECFVLTCRKLAPKMNLSHNQANKYLNEVLGRWKTLKKTPLLLAQHKENRIVMAKKFRKQ